MDVALLAFSVISFCISIGSLCYVLHMRDMDKIERNEFKIYQEEIEQLWKQLGQKLDADREQARQAAEELARLHNSSQQRFSELVDQMNSLNLKVTSATAMSQSRRGV